MIRQSSHSNILRTSNSARTQVSNGKETDEKTQAGSDLLKLPSETKPTSFTKNNQSKISSGSSTSIRLESRRDRENRIIKQEAAKCASHFSPSLAVEQKDIEKAIRAYIKSNGNESQTLRHINGGGQWPDEPYPQAVMKAGETAARHILG